MQVGQQGQPSQAEAEQGLFDLLPAAVEVAAAAACSLTPELAAAFVMLLPLDAQKVGSASRLVACLTHARRLPASRVQFSSCMCMNLLHAQRVPKLVAGGLPAPPAAAPPVQRSGSGHADGPPACGGAARLTAE